MADWGLKQFGELLERAGDSAAVKVGGIVAAAAAGVAVVTGAKHLHDKHEQQRQAGAMQQRQSTAELQQQIAQKRQEMSAICAKVGENNRPSGNFRAMVKGGNGIQQGPRNQQPDPNTGELVEIVQNTSLPI